LERWCLLIEIRWPYAHIRMCPVPLAPAVPLSTLLHASDLYAGHKEPENVNRLWLIGRHKMQGADDRNRQQEGKKNNFPSRLFASFAFMVRWHILYARRWPTQLSQRTFTLFYNTLFAVEFRPATVAQYPFELGGSWFLMAQTIAKSPTSVAIEPAPVWPVLYDRLVYQHEATAAHAQTRRDRHSHVCLKHIWFFTYKSISPRWLLWRGMSRNGNLRRD
jgi:hypothetical protein